MMVRFECSSGLEAENPDISPVGCHGENRQEDRCLCAFVFLCCLHRDPSGFNCAARERQRSSYFIAFNYFSIKSKVLISAINHNGPSAISFPEWQLTFKMV